MRTVRLTNAAILVLAFSAGLATSAAMADDAKEGVVYALDYSLGNGWVEVRLLPEDNGPDLVAVTKDAMAVAILTSAMAGGELVTIHVDGATPGTITRVEWKRPRVQNTIRQ